MMWKKIRTVSYTHLAPMALVELVDRPDTAAEVVVAE